MSKANFWTTPNGYIFYPRANAKKVKTLPPGVYSITQSMEGLYFYKNEYDLGDLIRFEDANVEKCLSEITSFWSKKDLFEKHKFPYKRGILLHGFPGTGKSSCVKLVIKEVVEMGGIVINFEDVDTFTSGMSLLRSIQKDTPVVVLMEDIDSILYNNNQSAILNILDGISGFTNIVYLATTNYLSKLEGRIKNRPSRFDRRFLIDFPNARSRKLYLEHIIGQSEDFKHLNIDEWVKATEGFTPAHLKELFLSVAFFGNDFNEVIERLKNMKSVNDYDGDEEYSDDADDDN